MGSDPPLAFGCPKCGIAKLELAITGKPEPCQLQGVCDSMLNPLAKLVEAAQRVTTPREIRDCLARVDHAQLQVPQKLRLELGIKSYDRLRTEADGVYWLFHVRLSSVGLEHTCPEPDVHKKEGAFASLLAIYEALKGLDDESLNQKFAEDVAAA